MNSFYYASLDKSQKLIYEGLLSGLKNIDGAIRLKSNETPQKILEIFSNIIYDFPELYYVKKSFNISSSVIKKELRLNYTYSKSQIIATNRSLESEANKIIEKNTTARQSEYEKVLVVHDYLKKNIAYDNEALKNDADDSEMEFVDSYTIIGALLKHKCVCAGFSLAMKYLCDKIGIDCHVIPGTGNSNIFSGPHAWNLVNIDGYYHHIDVTWDNQYANDSAIPNYGYFGLNDETISMDHSWNRNIYPKVSETPYNYFVMSKSLIVSKNHLEKYILENMRKKNPDILFKIKMENLTETEATEDIKRILLSDSSNIKNYYIQWIPTQLVFMIKINY
ncbi:MAG: hypothetical protein FWH48_06890 [Oscillospiraceae bacterium]|nr:hypothetical protein [Oscillospiraceae bacterium]